MDWYRAFEDRFRGSREDVKAKLRFYEARVRAHLAVQRSAYVECIDFGAGRGEWTDLLVGWGAKFVTAVEPDDEMCKRGSLRNERAWVYRTPLTALEYLDIRGSLCDVSLATAFHMVEHLPRAELPVFIERLHAALGTGALLIIETPHVTDWESFESFLTDPTRIAPVPPKLLSFFVEQAGFGQLEVVYPSKGDYAVVARKV